MMKKKLNNKKGFTLAELLIVVAIIGILVAVSVPVFTSQLEKAKTATDEANERAAKAAVTAMILAGDNPATTFYFDAKSGKAVAGTSGSIPEGIQGYGQTTSNSNKVIQIDVTGNEVGTPRWVGGN